MWKVYVDVLVEDPKYGRRKVFVEVCEGSKEYCEEIAANHPGAYVAWCCY